MSKRQILNYEFYTDYENISTPLLLADLEDLFDLMSGKIYCGEEYPNRAMKPESRQFATIYNELAKRLPREPHK